jgi:glycosyltransferase involved in cell wall biosynthesis
MEGTISILAFAIAFATLWLIDGLKVIIESLCCGGKHYKYTGKHNEVTVIVAAYNEEEVILNTIKSLSLIVPAENIIIVDDGSKDRTSELVRKYAPKVTLLTIANRGKVGAIHYALNSVKTPYVLLMDADTEFKPGFIIPTEALEKKHATAISFNVVPTVVGRNFINRFLLNLQIHEYAKSMQIGRRFCNPTKSVHCISGAAGLFCTERLKELSKKHTTIFPGEDLERTLLELASNGEVIFSDSTVLTDAPQTFWQLSKQRIVGWWPGLWRNIWLFLKLIFKRNRPFRMRCELIYEIFSLLTTPLKISSLFLMIIYQKWYLMLFIFGMYIILEIFVYFRIRKINEKYLKMNFLVISLFTFYSLIQMFYVTFAFFVAIYKKFLTKDWNKVVVMLTLLFTSSLFVKAQDVKKDWTVDVEYSRIKDLEKNRGFDNQNIYIGYKRLYATLTTTPYNTASIGGYFGPITIDTRYQWESKRASIKAQYEHWFGNFVPRLIVGYGTSELTTSVTDPSFPTAGLGFNYYFENKSNIGIEAIKEFGRLEGITYSLKTKIIKKSTWGLLGLSVTSFGDPGAFGQIGYEWLYLHGDYYQNFDFNNFDRISFGIGVKIDF